MQLKPLKVLLALAVFAGALITTHQVDTRYKKDTSPELRIEANANDFVLQYRTTAINQNIILPLNSTHNVVVNWGDGSAPVTRVNAGHLQKTIPVIGTYQIKITGTLTSYGFGSARFFDLRSSNLLLESVIQWGNTGVTNLQGIFMGADNLSFVPDALPTTVTDTSFMFHAKAFTTPLNNISNWNTVNITNMQSMFNSSTISTTDITNWNTSNVNNMQSMFESASTFNQNIGVWDVSKVTFFQSMFGSAFIFNADIGAWNTSSAQNLTGMFNRAFAFNKNINNWDTSKVTTMTNIFEFASAFNSPVNDWDVSNVILFNGVFRHASNFNQPLDQWDVSKGTSFDIMFDSAGRFNQNINSWNVSSAISLAATFRGASAFNQPLDNWNVSNVVTMFQAFGGASAFNQNINAWDVSKVTSLAATFSATTAFNQPLDAWNVGNVTNFSNTFSNSAFNQDISSWNVSKGTTFNSMFSSNTVFNKPLNTWDMSAATDISAMFSGASRFNQPLDNWNVSNVTFMNSLFQNAIAFDQDISLWNTSKVTQMFRMFFGATVFNQNISIWDVSKVTSFGGMFQAANAFNQPIGSWNTSSATTMGGMFSSNTIFDQYIGEWDVSKVTDFSFMFTNSVFNQDISGWTTSSATNMRDMFSYNKVFNIEIGLWDTSKVTTFQEMFRDSNFNQPIGDWDTANVFGAGLFRMFMGNQQFNHPIGSWNVAKATTFYEMFAGAVKFNQDLPWTTTALTQLDLVFSGATAFNGDVSSWDVSKVPSFTNIFRSATSFNQPLNTWNTAAATNFESMFQSATSFNQPLSNWNTSNVTNMQYVFLNASAFSQNLGTWDFQKVTLLRDFMGGSVNLNPLHYDAILQRLSNQTVTLNINLREVSFGQSKFSKVAKALKDSLFANRQWTIRDGGQLNLVIIADDTEKFFGEDDPTFTVSYEGLVTGAGTDTFVNNFVFIRTPGEAVGDYTLSVSGGDERYYYVTYRTGTFSVVKPSIDLSVVSWNYDEPFVYTGQSFTVTLDNVPSTISVTYTLNTATNAGTYTASVVITYDTVNYQLNGTIEPLTWIIEKADIDLTNVTWLYDEPFTYTGTLQTVVLSELPDEITSVTYTSNMGNNAGTYIANPTLFYDTNNYQLVGTINPLTWIIEKADIDLTNLTWLYDEPFTFNGSDQTVVLSELPDGISSVQYVNNIAANAGSYTANATLTYDTINYQLIGSISPLTWTIGKATYDMSETSWDYDEPLTFDLTSQSVTLIGLPEGVTVVSYAGNTQTQPGLYTASVVLGFDANNYFAPVIGPLDWEIFASTQTITFNANGGTAVTSITGILGSTITAPTNPTRPGFIFNGWNQTIPSMMPADSLMLTASWIAINTNANTNVDLTEVLDLSAYEGEDLTIDLVIELLNQEDLSEETLAAIETFVKDLLGDSAESFLYDIRLIIASTEGEVSVVQTEDGFMVTITLPETFEGENVSVVQYVDGVAQEVEATYDSETRRVTFSVQKLGTYAVAYPVNTFNIFTAVGIGGGVLGLLAGLWFFIFGRRKKKEKVIVKDVKEVEEVEGSMENTTFFTKDVKITLDFYQTLTAEEKVLFSQCFIEVHPSHLAKDLNFVIGGDNKEFFKNVFRFMYRYRKVISLSLLSKLTNYVISLADRQYKTQSLVYEAAMKTAYNRRKEAGFLDLTIDYARKDIALQRDHFNPRGIFIYSFYRLSIILEKQKNISEALVLVNEALARRLIDETKGGYVGRKQRLLDK